MDYIRVSHGEPHAARGRALLAAHPELRRLAGYSPSSGAWLLALVVLQMAIAVAVGRARWYVWLPIAYVAGATIDHALWALIHECSHNLIFRTRTPNRVISIVANIPIVVPGAISFTKYHLLHHRHMGELEFDAGVPGPTEARVIGARSSAKTAWIAGYALVQAIRPARMKSIPLFDGWTVANVAVQIVTMAALVALAGWRAFFYLLVSTLFAIGLHPVGGRWIQEHFALAPDQETYSYYGPLNRLSFNVGYHVEHHDLVNVPWSRLPHIRRLAPEFYEPLASYRSWSGLLLRFLTDRDITLFRYIVRPSRREQNERLTV